MYFLFARVFEVAKDFLHRRSTCPTLHQKKFVPIFVPNRVRGLLKLRMVRWKSLIFMPLRWQMIYLVITPNHETSSQRTITKSKTEIPFAPSPCLFRRLGLDGTWQWICKAAWYKRLIFGNIVCLLNPIKTNRSNLNNKGTMWGCLNKNGQSANSSHLTSARVRTTGRW